MATTDKPPGPSSKITDWVPAGDASGEFKRQASAFRSHVSRAPGARFPPEAGRYHLYVSYACPWASRTLIARHLKGLDQVVSLSAVHWHLGEGGWRFVRAGDEDEDQEAAVVPDPVPGHDPAAFSHLRHVYLESDPDYAGRFTVPVLYDKRERCIVSNESADILRMFNSEFDDLLDAEHRAVDLYPPALRARIDEANEWTYDLINNGVYKAGFATTAAAYERHVTALFAALDRAERQLASQKGPYFLGDALTELDVRLFVTLVRFDPVYVQHFKCNLRDLRSGYPALHRWLRALYWRRPAFRQATRFDHIKWHYTRSHSQINPLAITPLGPLPHILPLDDEVPAAKAAAAGAVG